MIRNQEIQKINNRLLKEKIKKSGKSLIKAAASGMLLMWRPLGNADVLPTEVAELMGEHLKTSDAAQMIHVCKKGSEFVKQVINSIELTDKEVVPYLALPLCYI